MEWYLVKHRDNFIFTLLPMMCVAYDFQVRILLNFQSYGERRRTVLPEI
jgi:hypothetical protein